MKNRKYTVWVYARREDSDPARVSSLAESLLKDAEAHSWTVAGVSQDMCAGRSLQRPGIKEVLRAIHSGLANAVLVESLDQISINKQVRRRFLKMLQNYGAILIATGTDLRYELWLSGLETVMIQRAARRHCGVPW